METIKPHIIFENKYQFQIGDVKQNIIHYDFDRILEYLDYKGKLLFGKKFKIYSEDKALIFKLCVYFIQDVSNCKKFNIDPNKGILLSGPVGCGKTSLMKLVKYILPHIKPYEVVPCRNITFRFNRNGFSTIQQYGDSNYYCFDDLGVEPTGKHYGADCNVMGEILLSRYDLFLKHKIRTHATANLNAQELEQRYGNRVRSRMRQLFNLLAFDKESEDKRQ